MERIRGYYDNSAQSLEKKKLGCRLDAEETKSILSSVPPYAKSLLDVGCGTGHLLDEARAEMKAGIDFSIGMLHLARRRGCVSQLILADARRLPFKNASFQVVVCQDVIGHFGNGEDLVKELVRSSASKGLIIATATKTTLTSRLISLYSRCRLGVYVSSHSLEDLEKIFEFSGARTLSNEVIRNSVVKILANPA